MSAKRKVKPDMEKIFLIGGPANGKYVQIPEGSRSPFLWNCSGPRHYTRRMVMIDEAADHYVVLWGHIKLSDYEVADQYFGGEPFTFSKPNYVPSTKEPHEFLQAE